jgi:hypothetical protein
MAAADAQAPAIGLGVGRDRQGRVADTELAQREFRDSFQIRGLHGRPKLYQSWTRRSVGRNLTTES